MALAGSKCFLQTRNIVGRRSVILRPYIELSGLIDDSQVKQQRRSESSPIYFFLHTPPLFPPLKKGLGVSTHTWSFDENGQKSILHHHCEYLGLPTEVRVHYLSSYICYWPSKTYKSIHEWQIARGFDPTTTDFACYLEYPIYEVQPSQFEELGVDQPEESCSFDGNLYVDAPLPTTTTYDIKWCS
ncbi:hypothetical protein E1B28_004900 [Marasmius oreades]|uniref:Uncharacterized protein n=1 Tax=Marasmius oreades TaxID=181124 RepID=A0A9P7UZM9_9AGAR|nr:uncharacterized protein E1B28_004900 [Marasmius oreades]KAG7097563.1 hypothetical protein E1B28_004900 [Marasmius oreades]